MEPFYAIYALKVIREKREVSFPIQQYCSFAKVSHAFTERSDQKYREACLVLLLNAKNKLVGYYSVSIGSATSPLVHPRELFAADGAHHAAAMILVHNHPSGDPTPSAEDLQITKRLHERGELFGIQVLDHIIIGCSRPLSFVEDGYWDNL